MASEVSSVSGRSTPWTSTDGELRPMSRFSNSSLLSNPNSSLSSLDVSVYSKFDYIEIPDGDFHGEYFHFGSAKILLTGFSI